MSNNRQRVSIPVLGIDTSTTDTQIKDGAMQELHNLRYSGGAWRDIKPFLEKNRAQLLKTPNLITVSPDGTVTAQYPVNQNVQVAATWSDIDGEHQSQTFTEILAGEARSEIDVRYDMLVSVIVSSDSEDNRYAYYSQFEDVPEVPLTAISPEKIIDVYQHPADEEDIYLIVSRSDIDAPFSINRVKIQEQGTEILQTLDYDEHFSWFSMSHFGNILMVFDKDYQRIVYYYLHNGEYKSFSAPNPPIVTQSTQLSITGDEDIIDPLNPRTFILPKQTEVIKLHGVTEEVDTDGEEGTETEITEKSFSAVPLYNPQSKIFTIPQIFNSKYWWGEICYFAIFETQNGELLAPGALNISSSEPFAHGQVHFFEGALSQGMRRMIKPSLIFGKKYKSEDYTLLISNSEKFIEDAVYPWSFAVSPHIKIQIPEGVNKDIIKGVRIYSTRIFPIWDIGALEALCEKCQREIELKEYGQMYIDISQNINKYFADNKLPEQPFYLMRTIPLNDFSEDGAYFMYITSELLENIEQKSAYQSVEAHAIFFDNTKEYNNRVHSTGPVTTKLFSGFSKEWSKEWSELTTSSTTELLIGNQSYFAQAVGAGKISDTLIANRVLSYPDYRAKYIYSPSSYESARFNLKEAIENNFAYAVNMESVGNAKDFDEEAEDKFFTYVKYSGIFFDVKEQIQYNEEDFWHKSTYTRTNVMRVSAPNNPFVFPLANTYAIGTEENEIIAVNSAAIELSDTKIGEFPLYVFTKDGIWVMRLGSGDILYDFDLPRFYDQAINPDTLAVNANLLYITSRGLHALHSSETSLISEALNDQFNVPELDFWKTAHLTHQPKYEEVIVYNLDKNESGNAKWPNAYVFSLGNQTWSTRSWVSGSEKLFQMPSRDIVLIDDLFRVFDCNEELRTEGDTSKIRLVSRPIKLGSMEFKRMETLIPRIEVDAAQPLRITIEASSDLVSWVTLREISTLTSNHTLTIRRTSCSARYFRIAMEVDVTHNFALSGFDMEYYLRFLHRLR